LRPEIAFVGAMTAAGGEYYEFRIRGLLGETLLGAFPGLRADVQGGETVLTGSLADQSALHGVLAQIELLGLELLDVHRKRSTPAVTED
jgi:hypothetical protein